MRRGLRVAGLGLWLVVATLTTYLVFSAWLIGPACTTSPPTTVQGKLCGDGSSAWSAVVLLAVVLSIFVPALLLLVLWRRVRAWALLPVVVVTAAMPFLCTVLLSLPPDH